MFHMILCLFYGIPIAAIIWFGISLHAFISAKRNNQREPGCVAPEEMKKRKITLIASSVIAGVLAAVVIGITVLFFLAIAFM